MVSVENGWLKFAFIRHEESIVAEVTINSANYQSYFFKTRELEIDHTIAVMMFMVVSAKVPK